WGWDVLLREEAAEQLSLLVAAAWSEGHELTVASAYRSFYDQVCAHSYYSADYATEADRVSAPPGHSEHRLGTTVDFTNAEVGYEILHDFGETDASRWLREHAAEYGFVMYYLKGGEEETGYIWEPWHYRYVGVEHARDIEESEGPPSAFMRGNGVKPGCG
ncbi:MAG: M15 family metallopeptidase, partial [Actinomycetota bacterium]|nr:M15 family metallopeptidase [Actinomycetota bacterium]